MVELPVPVLQWPEDAALRDGLAALGRARLLLVAPGAEPPEPVDLLEDWVPATADPAEVAIRARHLAARTAGPVPPPWLDDDGLLHHGQRWVALSAHQLAVARLLLDHLDRVVPFAQVAEASERSGGSPHPATVRTLLSRLGRRVTPVGLELVTVRQRGVLLRVAGPSTATAAPALLVGR